MRTLVVHCHPDPTSFITAARDRVVAALEQRGDEVRVNDLYAEDFDPLFTAGDHARHLEPGTDPSVARYADDLRWCRQLVLVYPTWWSGPPAMLKGWIDRVWVNGVAWHLPPGRNRLRGDLRNVRRIVAVTAHGSGRLSNALEGQVGRLLIRRMLRGLCHPLTRTRWIAFYGIDTAPAEQRRAFLERVERAFR